MLFYVDDGVRLHVEASVDSVSFSLVFEKMCTSAPYRITMKTRIPNCFIRVVRLSLRSFRLVYHQVQMKAVLFPNVCVCEGSVGHEFLLRRTGRGSRSLCWSFWWSVLSFTRLWSSSLQGTAANTASCSQTYTFGMATCLVFTFNVTERNSTVSPVTYLRPDILIVPGIYP